MNILGGLGVQESMISLITLFGGPETAAASFKRACFSLHATGLGAVYDTASVCAQVYIYIEMYICMFLFLCVCRCIQIHI